MAGFTGKKRSRDEKPRLPKGRPAKKPRKQREYHSSSEDDEEEEGPGGGQDFAAVNLLDSDAEDLDNMAVDDGESSGGDDSSSDGEGSSREEGARVRSKATKPTKTQAAKKAQARKAKSGGGDGDSGGDSDGSNNNNNNNNDNTDDDSEGDSDSDSDGSGAAAAGSRRGGGGGKKQSKRNDPAAFATSMSKILSTKLSTSRRADPVLARSAEAHEAARLAVDSALEAKAHRKMAEQRRLALDKGRVRDVLVATNNNNGDGGVEEKKDGGDGDERRQATAAATTTTTTTSEMLEAEKRLRKVAQRGVIKLFNAVRAAQVKAADAQRAVRADGVVGMNRREEKVTEMTKKGFLDLIAAGGGGLKKGPLEEA
ncbi:hypothetical protein RB597_008284 [Gaeumannomyces tritici]